MLYGKYYRLTDEIKKHAEGQISMKGPNSMTGFARREMQASWGMLSCEVRSVNHRYLEMTIRLPEMLRPLELKLREKLRKSLHRGKVEVTLHLNKEVQSQDELTINTALVKQLTQSLAQISAIVPNSLPVDPLALLQWPGVIEKRDVDADMLAPLVLDLFEDTLSGLIEHRHREGSELDAHIKQRLRSISTEAERIRSRMPQILLAQKEKLRQRLDELQQTLDAERLEQEITLLASKADIDEELDRLDTHVNEVEHVLGQSGAIGRRLDFMMQELNREANTLSSKSLTSDITQGAVSLKVLIEQMREQIQNIE